MTVSLAQAGHLTQAGHGDRMDGMESPSGMRIRVDDQGRMVLPRAVREEIVRVPGEVLLRRTADGLLLSAAHEAGVVAEGTDGLPVLTLGRPVRNREVLAAIEQERRRR